MCFIDTTRRLVAQRLSLRDPQPRDAARIAVLANDFGVAAMTTAMPFPYAEDDARSFLGQARDPSREALFAIEHPDVGLIGMIGFKGERSQPEIGYWLGRDFWGRGYATEATNAALVWAREDWGKRCVRASHFADNVASAEVLWKTGFLYTGDVTLTPSRARNAPATARHMVWLA